MSPRLDMRKAAPQQLRAMVALSEAVEAAGLDKDLCELVKIRASQINGCGYCLHMHSLETRRAGEREERLHLLAAWRESTYFSPREQAALAWTEALTLIQGTGAPDDVYRALQPVFSETEIAQLSFLITTINAWNRLAVGFRMVHPRAWSAAA